MTNLHIARQVANGLPAKATVTPAADGTFEFEWGEAHHMLLDVAAGGPGGLRFTFSPTPDRHARTRRLVAL